MLKLHKNTVLTIFRWASKYPTIEVTGLVARGKERQRVQPMQNIARDPAHHYEWDPQEMAEAWDRMDRRGEEPMAFYHSHPSGKSDPSERDMEGALHVGMYYLIAYPVFTGGRPDAASWLLSAWECIEMGILVEAKYEVVP
jgi:proteasome lid subunit RPN8/RPN11